MGPEKKTSNIGISTIAKSFTANNSINTNEVICLNIMNNKIDNDLFLFTPFILLGGFYILVIE